jgi:hypothetical protein
MKSLACAGAVVYALFVVLAPFGHHDLACHLKTPQHCSSCSSSVVGSEPGALAVLDASNLRDAGCAAGALLLAEGYLLSTRTASRSPPVAA